MSKQTEELKPCPFCGGEPETLVSGDDVDLWAYVSCSICDAQGKEVYFSDGGRTAKQVAAEYWNNRANEWQPIETAPKDASRILIYDDEFGRGIVYWHLNRKCWCSDEDSILDYWEPTHWQPLPEVPKG